MVPVRLLLVAYSVSSFWKACGLPHSAGRLLCRFRLLRCRYVRCGIASLMPHEGGNCPVYTTQHDVVLWWQASIQCQYDQALQHAQSPGL